MVSSPTGKSRQSMPWAAIVSPISARFCAPSFSSSGISPGNRDRPLPTPWVRLAEQKPPFRPDAAQPVVSASTRTTSADGSRSARAARSRARKSPRPRPRGRRSADRSARARAPGRRAGSSRTAAAAPRPARRRPGAGAVPARASGSFGIIAPRFLCRLADVLWPASHGDGKIFDSGRAPPARFRAAVARAPAATRTRVPDSRAHRSRACCSPAHRSRACPPRAHFVRS